MFESFGENKKLNHEKPMTEEKKMGEVVSLRENVSVEEFEEKVSREKQEARESLRDLIEAVNKRYEGLPEKMREDFIAHNEELLESVIELGIKKEFSPKQLRVLEIAATWHDADKAEAAPEEFKDVPNYALLVHGEKAAGEIQVVLTDEILAKNGFEEAEFAQVRLEVAEAIRQHMGPHPGFMTAMLEGANKKLLEMGKAEIVHPKAEGKISEALLAADMKSLAGEKGRKKVLAIRANVPFFKKQDEDLCAEYLNYGIELKPEEAALMSGFDSAFQARDMLTDQKNQSWVDEAIESSKKVAYVNSEGNEMVWSDVEGKRRLYETAKNMRQAA